MLKIPDPRFLISNTLWDHWRVHFLQKQSNWPYAGSNLCASDPDKESFGRIHHLPIYTDTDSTRFLELLTSPIPIFRYEYYTDTDFLKNTDTDYWSKKWTIFIRWCGPPRLHLSMHIPLVLNAEPFLCDSRGLRLLLLLNKIGTNINKVIIGMIWTSPNSARLFSKIPDWPGYLRNC